ncbi:MAG: CBS domain-containing protein, partial [Thermoanaerobaculia bacterium]
ILRSLQVRDVRSQDPATLPANRPLAQLLEELADQPRSYYYVTDDPSRLRGVIALGELRRALLEDEALSGMVVAGDLARTDVPMVTPNQNLDTVMRIFAGKDRDELPVVDSHEQRRLLGTINRGHLLDAYNRQLMKRDMVAGLSGGLSATATDEVMLDGDHRMAELDAPGEFLGKTIGEMDVRNRYKVQVLLIRRRPHGPESDTMELVPGPDLELQRGDRLVVLGRSSNIDRLRKL